MKEQTHILHVAIDTPLRRHFDYLLPPNCEIHQLIPGIRLRVPFGKKNTIGLLLAVDQQTDVESYKLKPAIEILDEKPVLTESVLALMRWASQYYQHPIGDVVMGSLPALLRRGRLVSYAKILCDDKDATPAHCCHPEVYCHPERSEGSREESATPRSLALLGMTAEFGMTAVCRNDSTLQIGQQFAYSLNEHQQQALDSISNTQNFSIFLLDGVTGSGKTEVYLQAIAEKLNAGLQALVLVPEIGLTPQTVARFQQRFNQPIAVLHSGLTDLQRHKAWLQALHGEARIIIGTRSAIFIPLAQPGIIILDEEHDNSFKQQSGFRYSARDLAILRGRLENIPVILGSATASLETFNNAKKQRYEHLSLPHRVGKAVSPKFHVVDIRNQFLEEGLSDPLLQTIKQHLTQQGQVLLFLNRRGYAPIFLCHSCGWSARCKRCDARLVAHQSSKRLICHHCGYTQIWLKQCTQCKGSALSTMGMGTEQLEQVLRKYFPDTELIRIDKDTTRRKGTMEKMLASIHNGHSQILIGTQMLAKGHHFPNVTLVAILDIDGALYSTDFRASERMAQLIIQVAGRAGRVEKPGEVLLQTHAPEHPHLQILIHQGYRAFIEQLLQERKLANWPPFSHLALLRAEAVNAENPLNFLKLARQAAEKIWPKSIQILGPIPAPMERKAGKFRVHLLLQSKDRQSLQERLPEFIARVETLSSKPKVRWSVDVDPLEFD
jgi:primosomal protein N' (replication factor Y)